MAHYIDPITLANQITATRAGGDPTPLLHNLYLLADTLLGTYRVTDKHERDDLRQELVIAAYKMIRSDLELTKPFTFCTSKMIFKLREIRARRRDKQRRFEEYCTTLLHEQT